MNILVLNSTSLSLSFMLMNADDCWLIYAYRSLSGSLRTAYYCYITTPAPSLTSPASSSPALSLSLLPLSLPSIPLLLLLFRTPASFFHHCAGHTSSLLSFSLSLLTISLLTLLCLFFFFFIPPLFSLQPTALPHKKPNSPGITKQTLDPINISNRHPLRGLLSAIDASLDNQFESSCLVFRVKGIRNAL